MEARGDCVPRDYEAHKRDMGARQAERSRAGRDIGDSYRKHRTKPGVLKRRRECEFDFRRFCEQYFPAAFPLPWSPDHLRVIAKIEQAVLHGGLFAMAMPRGSGKTTLCIRAALWALLHGHRMFVCLVGATQDDAQRMLLQLRTELQFNDRLLDSFREVCFPIRCLEGSARKVQGQTFDGEQTLMDWSANKLTLPTLPTKYWRGKNVSGATVAVAGLTGSLKGKQHTLRDGTILRPSLVLLDDIQTRESAMSPSQTAERLAIVRGDVLAMAGPSQKIAAVMPCTVIQEGDLSDQLLDRERNPQWQGERTKAVYQWPHAEKLWDRYNEIRREGLRTGEGDVAATEFYRSNQDEMDDGAKIAWPERRNEEDLSALQTNMNLRSDLGEAAFAAEYQNEPLKADAGELPLLTAAEITSRVNGFDRGTMPTQAERVTAFIDVHESLLFWAVCGWSLDFQGWLVGYGTWPRQSRVDFALRKAAPTMRQALAGEAAGASVEGLIYTALGHLTAEILGRDWRRSDGASLRVERCLIDAGWMPDPVYQFCRANTQSSVLTPSRGVGIRARGRPMREFKKHRGDRIGWYWYMPGPHHGKAERHLRYDANFWKTFIHKRLGAVVGDKASLSLFGSDSQVHRLLAEHFTAEFPTRVSANGRVVDEWQLRPGGPDNHWLDCLVGCAAAASFQGCVAPGAEDAARPAARRDPSSRPTLGDLA